MEEIIPDGTLKKEREKTGREVRTNLIRTKLLVFEEPKFGHIVPYYLFWNFYCHSYLFK
jgi:hypothetical protein